MTTSENLMRAIRLMALGVVALGVGAAVALAVAMLGHEYLVLTLGEEGIRAVDGTPLM